MPSRIEKKKKPGMTAGPECDGHRLHRMRRWGAHEVLPGMTVRVDVLPGETLRLQQYMF
ncbi:hypothetical protein [Caballeronia sp. Lep1P3]|uniref:hypothetical protein n=1 Tax=Caballeronia sp. Lep1P3 TaxID=2878150 RepID=UPI001FD1C770|nr:hypothetical protein [Caballeronia sp. Lep1P3]